MALDAIRQMGLIAFRIRNQGKNFFLFRLRQRFLMPDVHPGDLRQRNAEQLPQAGFAGMQHCFHSLIGPGEQEQTAQKQRREAPASLSGHPKPAEYQRHPNGCGSIRPQKAAQRRQKDDRSGIAALFQAFRFPASLRQQAQQRQQRRAKEQILGGGHHQKWKSGQKTIGRRQQNPKAALHAPAAQQSIGIGQRSSRRTGLHCRIQRNPRVIASYRAAQPVERRQQQRMQRRECSVVLAGGELRRFPR